MDEFIVVSNGPNETLVVRRIDETFKVIAKCENRDNAVSIVEAMNPVEEVRTTWSDLERVAHERGLR